MMLHSNKSREQNLQDDLEWYRALVRSLLEGEPSISRAAITFSTESLSAPAPRVFLQATREESRILLQDLSSSAHHAGDRVVPRPPAQVEGPLHRRGSNQGPRGLGHSWRRRDGLSGDKSHVNWSPPYLECENGSYKPGWLVTLSAAFYRSQPNLVPEFRTPLHLACISGCPGVVALLIQFNCDLNARDKERTTALIRAVQSLNRGCAGILLEHGANPNLEDGGQNTALHYAILEESVSIATQLLRHHANIEAINKSNLTPFLLAVKENKKEMVRFLIENGANVHAVDNVQRSALILAVFHDSPDIVKLLLQEGVSPYSQDSRGWSAEQYAYSNGFEQ
ncbi:ankyrin repeat domain-containing protein 7 [Camelus dromedarius]|uniref:ankyrin repeat domain-containing protein 7 n=1 Tax=Camelus dromedarius TaxID=9838 RepID=UPI003119C811